MDILTMENGNALRYRIITASLCFLSAVLLLSACNDFLSEQPKGQVSGEVVETPNGVKSLLIGAYNALNPVAPPPDNPQGIAGGNAWMSDPSHWPFGAITSDVAEKGSIPNDQAPANDLQRHSWNSTNPYFDALWSNRFEGVSRANSVLKTLGKVEDISDSEATRIEAEARFLRAYFYFDLKKNFGNVPWIDETTEDLNQPNNIEEEIIWPKIEEDLKFAMSNLPEVMPDPTRANRWSAAAYLAKAYVFQEKWDEAKPLYDDIISSGVTASGVPYELEEQYNYNFNAARQGEDWSEVVFAVEMTADDGTGSNSNAWAGYVLNYPHAVAPFQCCGFFQPSHDLVNSFKTTSNGLPSPDGFTEAFNNMGAVLKNDQGTTSETQFTPAQNASLDPRLDWTVGRRGIPFLDHGPHPGARYDRGGHDYAGPYHAKKHVWWNRNADVGFNTAGFFPGSGVDYPTMRFADVLLMAAEAELQSSSGTVQQALNYVNRVRNRAANPDGFVKNSDNEGYALAVVGSEAEMLATNPQPFDWVVRTDRNSTFTYLGTGPANDISNWNEYPNPTDNYHVEPYTMAEFQSAPGPLRKVEFERKLELSMEGHRFYDLVRWGRAETRMSEYFEYQGNLTGDVDPGDQFMHGIFPIPQNQIDISVTDGEQVLKQNPQY